MKPRLVIIIVLSSIVFGLISASATAQRISSFTGMARGQGTLTAGHEKYKINSVRIDLKENGDAEIVLFTELQLLISGRWSATDDSSKGINLQITGGVVSDEANGGGTLFLGSDGKAISRLSIQAKGRAGSKVSIQFMADKQNSQ
jgi:hypothetical protein